MDHLLGQNHQNNHWNHHLRWQNMILFWIVWTRHCGAPGDQVWRQDLTEAAVEQGSSNGEHKAVVNQQIKDHQPHQNHKIQKGKGNAGILWGANGWWISIILLKRSIFKILLYYETGLFVWFWALLTVLPSNEIRILFNPEQWACPPKLLTMLNHFSEDGSSAESWAGEPLPHISSHCKQALPGGQVSKSFVSSILNSFNRSDFRQQGCAWIIFSSSESQVYNSLFSGHSFPIAIHKGWTNDWLVIRSICNKLFHSWSSYSPTLHLVESTYFYLLKEGPDLCYHFFQSRRREFVHQASIP